MRRVTVGEALAGVGGLVLVVDLFVDWYEGSNAFASFTVVLLLLVVTALLGLALLGLTVFQPSQAHPVAAGVWGNAIGWPTLIVVLIRLLATPDGLAVRAGAIVGALAVAAVAFGSFLALRHEERPPLPSAR